MEKINQILKDIFNVNPSGIDKTYDFRDFETWDSMAYMYLIAEIEKEFKIELTGDEIVQLVSIERIEQILKARNVI